MGSYGSVVSRKGWRLVVSFEGGGTQRMDPWRKGRADKKSFGKTAAMLLIRDSFFSFLVSFCHTYQEINHALFTFFFSFLSFILDGLIIIRIEALDEILFLHL